MKLIRLYLENFICYEISEIDFTTFSSALIVGKINGNDIYSNGTGKSSIFKAIEYVLFNQARETKLEKLVRDGTTKCKVVLDIESNGKIYRISRSRTAKGTSDLSLFERNGFDDQNVNPYSSALTEEQVKLFWNNISSRRTNDTEEDLKKLHKVNLEAFLSTNHFIQNDFTGLPTATAGQRKKILKEALQLIIYTKLEKIASEESKLLSKELDKKRAALNAIGDPQKDIDLILTKIIDIDNQIISKTSQVESKKTKVEDLSFRISELTSKFSTLDSQSAAFVKKQADCALKVKKLETSVAEADQRRKNAAQAGKDIIKDKKELKSQEKSIPTEDLEKLDSLKNNVVILRDKGSVASSNISNLKLELVDLKIPMPDDSLCKHCRQPLTDAHRQVCKNLIKDEISTKEQKITELQVELSETKKKILATEEEIKSIENRKRQLESLTIKIDQKDKEISDKIKIHDEYNVIWQSSKNELNDVLLELEQSKLDVENSSSPELVKLRNEISDERQKLIQLKKDLDQRTIELNTIVSSKAVLDFSLKEKQSLLSKKSILDKEIFDLDESYNIYPDVVEAFGSRGIPNQIVQNILDELQTEANNLLTQLKPGLQLAFSIEKTKGDGEVDDDLEINYFLNGKGRDYGQLSGAMKLCALFSLKLGLSFLLQKKIGAEINFLLIDEIDQSLDKAGVDAFADIIKFFQKDFTILVITHNDRLKDKFSHAILVDQDRNMISKAQVVSSW